MRAPQIRTEVGTVHRALGGGFNRYGQVCGTAALSAEDRVEAGIRLSPEGPPQGFNRDWDKVANVGHPHHNMPYLGTCKCFGANLHDAHGGDYVPMSETSSGSTDVWPRRMAYKAKLREYCDSTEKTHDDVARELGLSLSHFHNAIYRPNKRLGIDSLKRSAQLFGCSITLFVDDPGGSYLGQDLSGLSDQARFIASLILEDVASDDLTDDDRRFLYADFQRGLDRLRSLRARAATPGGEDRPLSGGSKDGDLAQSMPLRVAKKQR